MTIKVNPDKVIYWEISDVCHEVYSKKTSEYKDVNEKKIYIRFGDNDWISALESEPEYSEMLEQLSYVFCEFCGSRKTAKFKSCPQCGAPYGKS